MPVISVPKLGPEGWVSDKNELLNELFKHAMASDLSQSNMYLGSVTSIPGIIQRSGNDMELLLDTLSVELRYYVERYFDSAEVSAVDSTPNEEARREIDIDVTAYHDGVAYNLGAALRATTNQATKYFMEVIGR